MRVFDNKDPGETTFRGLNWTPGLAPGDTIVSSTWSIVTSDNIGSSLQIAVSPAPSFTSTATQLWLTGGTKGFTYVLLNVIVTAGGETLDERAQLFIAVK